MSRVVHYTVAGLIGLVGLGAVVQAFSNMPFPESPPASDRMKGAAAAMVTLFGYDCGRTAKSVYQTGEERWRVNCGCHEYDIVTHDGRLVVVRP